MSFKQIATARKTGRTQRTALALKFRIIPAPEKLKQVVECFRVAEYIGEDRLAIKVSLMGISPQLYIRVKRFNKAVRLIKTRQFDRLTDVAYAFNFYDQSHFIRDVKAFSGITPKSLSQKEVSNERIFIQF